VLYRLNWPDLYKLLGYGESLPISKAEKTFKFRVRKAPLTIHPNISIGFLLFNIHRTRRPFCTGRWTAPISFGDSKPYCKRDKSNAESDEPYRRYEIL